MRSTDTCTRPKCKLLFLCVLYVLHARESMRKSRKCQFVIYYLDHGCVCAHCACSVAACALFACVCTQVSGHGALPMSCSSRMMHSSPQSLHVDLQALDTLITHGRRFYEKMQYRDCTIEAWDKLQNARDRYRSMAGPVGMHKVWKKDSHDHAYCITGFYQCCWHAQ